MSDEKEKIQDGNEEKEEAKDNGEEPENKPVPEDKAMEDALEDPDKAHKLLEAQIEDTETLHKLTLICREDPVPMEEMRKIAIERGLVSNRNRKKLWPKLLGINRHSAESFSYRQKAVRGHQDANTVAVDVERSAWLAGRVTGDTSSADTQLKNLRRSLQRLINGVVCSHPGDVFYYQGFHDVAAVVMLVMGEDAAYPVLEVMAMHHLRDCSRPSLELVMQYLKLFFPLLRHEDMELFEFLKQAEKEAEIGHDDTGSHFAVPWVLTWFAHAMSDLPAAARLFDFFLCTDPTMPLYYSVVMLKHNRDRILNTRCDYAELRALMSNLPAVDQLEVRELISKTISLSQQLSPDQLQALASLKLPPDSTLFTFPYMWMSIPVRKDAVMRKIANSKARFEPATGDMAGWGTYLYPNGNRFRGSFNQQKRHGLGQFTWARTAEKYDGEWRNDKRHGFGCHTWHDGTKYEGEFKYDTLNGDGVYQWPDGRRFEGRFRADKQDGFAVYYDAQGAKCGGHWIDGVLTRKVELKLCQGSATAANFAAGKGREARVKIQKAFDKMDNKGKKKSKKKSLFSFLGFT